MEFLAAFPLYGILDVEVAGISLKSDLFEVGLVRGQLLPLLVIIKHKSDHLPSASEPSLISAANFVSGTVVGFGARGCKVNIFYFFDSTNKFAFFYLLTAQIILDDLF